MSIAVITGAFYKCYRLLAKLLPYTLLVKFADDILAPKGLPLSAKFSVKMPDTWTPIFDLSNKEKVQLINDNAEPEIDHIIGQIQNCADGDFMKNKKLGTCYGAFTKLLIIIIKKQRLKSHISIPLFFIMHIARYSIALQQWIPLIFIFYDPTLHSF